jgi:predicted transcriptional regulator
MEGRAALISVRPYYANKILSGEKKVEFRRTWAIQQVHHLLIYSTSPVKRLVAIADVKSVIVASPSGLWTLSKEIGGGITRERLFAYLSGKSTAVAIELSEVRELDTPLSPKKVLGRDFRPPQSFRYLDAEKFMQVKRKLTR